MNFRFVSVLLASLLLASCANLTTRGENISTESEFKPFRLIVDLTPIESKMQLEEVLAEDRKSNEYNDRLTTPDGLLTGFSGMFNPIPVREKDNGISKFGIGSSRCANARKEKERWHLEHQGVLPAAFGKMTNYAVFKVNDEDNLWAGYIETCSWVLPFLDDTIEPENYNENSYVEYYFNIAFPMEFTPGQLKAHKSTGDDANPFPDTLDFTDLKNSTNGDVEQFLKELNDTWNWKLHAKGSAMSIIEARRNGYLLSQNDPILQDDENMCFDLFFALGEGEEPQDMTLPTQEAYCMGRCNARILNTP